MLKIHHTMLVAATILVALPAQDAAAQTRSSEDIAKEWRAVRRDELRQQRLVLDDQIKALDDRATPDPVPVGHVGAPHAPAFGVVAQPAGLAAIPAPPADPAGQPPVAPPGSSEFAPPTAEAIAKAVNELAKKPGGTFGGIDFGGGISFTLDIGTSDRISDAALVNNIVRVNDENNGRARIMLESHYLFTPMNDIPFLGLENTRAQKQWGWGPFIALQPGTDDVIEAVGMGVMFGVRRGAGDQSFNLGFGVVVDPNTRILGEGLLPNKPLPIGETAVRYKEEMQTGILILSSFSF